jgi:hypothetical protein
LFGDVWTEAGAWVGFFAGLPRWMKTSATALGYSWALWSAGLGMSRATATDAARAKEYVMRLAALLRLFWTSTGATGSWVGAGCMVAR